MKELLDVFSALAALINKYGAWVVILVVGLGILILQFDKVWSGLGKLAARILPAWTAQRRAAIQRAQLELVEAQRRAEEERRLAREQQEYGRKKDEQDRIDIQQLQRDVLLEYRERNNDLSRQNERMMDQYVNIARGYEAAQQRSEIFITNAIEAMRMINDGQRMVTDRLGRIEKVIHDSRSE